MERKSALSRLRGLPDVITLPYLCRSEGWSTEMASVYIANWRKKGLLELAGPRTGVYYNLSSSPEVSEEMRLKALCTLYPSAVLAGESVLHAAGWTTQIPVQMSVAVLSRPKMAAIDGFAMMPRSRRWFQKHQDVFVEGDNVPFSTFGLKAIPPAHALVDMYLDPKAWHPDPDDLDLDADALGALSTLDPSVQEILPDEIRAQVPTFVPSRPKMR